MRKWKTLVLFDVDGTLVRGAGPHIKAFSFAFKEVYGVNAEISVINYHGMTDQQIILEVLKKSGLPRKVILSGMNNCMSRMVDYFVKEVSGSGTAITEIEHVRKFLDHLSEGSFLLGLVTGNLERIAMHKLKIVNLDHYFEFGGFGSDAVARDDLVRIAVDKAIKNFHFHSTGTNIFLIGDTPKDLLAAKLAGVRSVGVATGAYSKNQLYDAEFVCETLENTEQLFPG